jgi:crossover junction endodeoxyribonuclease RuvC
MIILGVDPSCISTGYAILSASGNKAGLLDYGVLPLPSKKPLAERVHIFYTFLEEKIRTYHVTHLSIETPFLGKNAQNFLKLGYLRGVLLLLSSQHALVLYEFSPREIKRSLTGQGGASKQQVARTMMRLFPGLAYPKKFDLTDALAITVAGLWHKQCSLL